MVSLENRSLDLILSEYGEGPGYDKYIEIFNGTGQALDLSAYSLRIQRNGTNDFTSDFPLTGNLPDNTPMLIVNSQANPELLNKANLVIDSRTQQVINFNGDDAVGLFKNGVLLDVVGIVDAGSVNWGADKTLVRNSDVKMPNAVYDPFEWTVTLMQKPWVNAGFHKMDGLVEQRVAPSLTIEPDILAPTAYVGIEYTITVTGWEPNGDPVTVSQAALPAGAVLTPDPSVGSSPVSAVYTWTPTTTGDFTATFTASDDDGAADPINVDFAVEDPSATASSLIAYFNEIRANGTGTDSNEFVEIVAPAGTNLMGCFVVHYNGSSTVDGELWRFTFPSFMVPNDGIKDTNGVTLGFAVLAQTNSAVENTDFFIPFTSAAGDIQNGPDGLVLYDSASNILDAVAWEGAGDMAIDDPGGLVTSGDARAPNYLHVTSDDDADDDSLSAPNNVRGDSGAGWDLLFATPGAINSAQTDGDLVITPEPPPMKTGAILSVW